MLIRHRLAHPQGARAIGVLAPRDTQRWVLCDQPASAAAGLLYDMSARVIFCEILAGQRFHLAWAEDGRLVGMAAMREDSRLFQFCVSTRLHGQGNAGRVWHRAMEDARQRVGTRHFTLYSSAVDVPVYRHGGFVCSGPLRVGENGLVTQPMHLDRP